MEPARVDVDELIDVAPLLDEIHAAMIAGDGHRPETHDERSKRFGRHGRTGTPSRLVLGSDGFDGVVDALMDRLRDVRSHETGTSVGLRGILETPSNLTAPMNVMPVSG